ncbi:MAG: hypothetical protein IKV94_01805 [Clostridia bacterium]|nr:hypothetical protein [Clostridia bacterium]
MGANKKAISLIVLIITIIVLGILAGTAIITLSDSGIISMAKNVIDEANIKEIQHVATVLYADAYATGARTNAELKTAVIDGLSKHDNINLNKYAVILDGQGVKIEVKNAENSAMTVEELKEKYEFEYYATLSGAVDAVNNGTAGDNTGVAEADAEAGIFKYNNKTYVVLLKDTTLTTRLKPSADMVIVLGGYTLSSNDGVSIDSYSGNVTVDGRLEGSAINSGTAIQIRAGNFVINGGTYSSSTEGKTSTACINSAGTLTIKDATISASGTTGTVYGVNHQKNTTSTISDCNITSSSTGGTARALAYGAGTIAKVSNCEVIAVAESIKAYGISNSAGTVTVSDSDVYAYANYATENGAFTALSQGAVNTGTLNFNNCNVMGNHSGISNGGVLNINGGTYEGYGHGGIYFSAEGTTSYVCNATIRQCDMTEGYIDGGVGSNDAGFYVGGSSNGSNMKIYMDNCDIYGEKQPIVLRGTNGETNNTLYISNSTINLGSTNGIRIDNNTHKLYIGKGCNFTAMNTNLESAVVETNEVYIKK